MIRSSRVIGLYLGRFAFRTGRVWPGFLFAKDGDDVWLARCCFFLWQGSLLVTPICTLSWALSPSPAFSGLILQSLIHYHDVVLSIQMDCAGCSPLVTDKDIHKRQQGLGRWCSQNGSYRNMKFILSTSHLFTCFLA